MKYSLLELTQNILSSMDSDEVNSISDTTEARQVSEIIRTAYFNILSRANLPEHQKIFSLVASGDNDLPVLMTKPDDVSRIEWIKYNKATTLDPEDFFDYVTILPLKQFLDMTQQFSTGDTNVDTLTFDDHTFYFKTDQAPTYCTILEDNTVVFDSFDSDVDTTLQISKSMCFGQTIPVFSLTDDFTPDLDDQQFPLLLNEAKSLAFLELKNTANDASVLESRRQWRTLQRTKHLNEPIALDQFANFGRK